MKDVEKAIRVLIEEAPPLTEDQIREVRRILLPAYLAHNESPSDVAVTATSAQPQAEAA